MPQRIVDIVFDVYYSNVSFEAKMSRLGLYLEYFLRMRFEIKGRLQLGDRVIKKKCNQLHFGKEIFNNIKKIKDKRNHASHSENDTPIFESDFQEQLTYLEKIFILFFCEYFYKYPFGSKTHIADSLSLLPPQTRVEILNTLYKDKAIKSDEICLLNKLCLATLKAKGLDCAKQWIEENKEKLQSIKMSIEIDEMSEIDIELQKMIALEIEQQGRTMYDVCLEKVELVHEAREKGAVPTYTNYEEAQKYYEIYRPFGNDSEEQEFIDLIDFIFTGRDQK